MLLASDVPERFRYRDAPLLSQSVQPYVRMELTTVDQGTIMKTVRFGRLETVTYANPEYSHFRHYEKMLRKVLLSRVHIRADNIDARQHDFLISNDPEAWLRLQVFRNRYVVKYLKPGTYPRLVSMGVCGDYHYDERLAESKNRIPCHPLIPTLENFVITQANYRRLDKHAFSLGNRSVSVEGRLWELRYEYRGSAGGIVRRYALLHGYRDLLKRHGVKIMEEDVTHIVFHSDAADKKIWGEFGCSDVAARLTLMEEQPGATETILDANALKKILDASGHVALKGVYFDTAKATLKPESVAALKAAAALLRRYPDLELAVEGHTDNVGSAAENERLSQKRAEAVKESLIKMGIGADRLKAKGYGETRPVASNDDETGRAKNRRVELRQLSNSAKVAAIDASFFQPIHHARVVEKKRISYDTFIVQQKGEPKKLTVRGDAQSIRYILLKNGRRDRSVSAYEILSSFKKTIPAFGGKIIGGAGDKAIFKIPKGAGEKDVYGSIDASMGSYHIYTIVGEEVLLPADKKVIK